MKVPPLSAGGAAPAMAAHSVVTTSDADAASVPRSTSHMARRAVSSAVPAHPGAAPFETFAPVPAAPPADPPSAAKSARGHKMSLVAIVLVASLVPLMIVGALIAMRSSSGGSDSFRGDPNAVYQNHQPVDIVWQGAWHPGSVLIVNGPRYRVRYEGREERFDEWVTAERLRPRQQNVPPPRQP